MRELTDLTIDAFYQLLEEEYGKDFKPYFIKMYSTQRIGQAFFNSLPSLYQMRLRGSIHDPFHRNSWMSVIDAIEFLTTK